MKNNLKTIWLLTAALVIVGIYSCQMPDSNKFDGTKLKLNHVTVLLPKGFRQMGAVTNDSSGYHLTFTPEDSIIVGPPPHPPVYTVVLNGGTVVVTSTTPIVTDSIIVGPPPKGN